MLQVPKLYVGSKAIRQINVTAACGGLVKLMLQMLPVAQEATLPCDQSCRMAAACLLLPGLPVQICNIPCVEKKCKKEIKESLILTVCYWEGEEEDFATLASLRCVSAGV